MTTPAITAEELVAARAAAQQVVANVGEQLGGRTRAVGFVEEARVVAARAERLDPPGVGGNSHGRLSFRRMAAAQMRVSCELGSNGVRWRFAGAKPPIGRSP